MIWEEILMGVFDKIGRKAQEIATKSIDNLASFDYEGAAKTIELKAKPLIDKTVEVSGGTIAEITTAKNSALGKTALGAAKVAGGIITFTGGGIIGGLLSHAGMASACHQAGRMQAQAGIKELEEGIEGLKKEGKEETIKKLKNNVGNIKNEISNIRTKKGGEIINKTQNTGDYFCIPCGLPGQNENTCSHCGGSDLLSWEDRIKLRKKYVKRRNNLIEIFDSLKKDHHKFTKSSWCESCDIEYPENDKFCSKCGTKTSKLSEDSVALKLLNIYSINNKYKQFSLNLSDIQFLLSETEENVLRHFKLFEIDYQHEKNI